MISKIESCSRRSVIAGLGVLAWAAPGFAQQQVVDPEYQPVVRRPEYRRRRRPPQLAIDAAHRNFHRMDGQYAPFAALMRADGWTVSENHTAFSRGSLHDVDLLVIANAGSEKGADTNEAAFTLAEANALAEWVYAGGGLLLIADHAPFGICARPLAEGFGFGMGNGWVYQPTASGSLTTQLIFDAEDGGLARDEAVMGRRAEDGIGRVKTFTGQSLVPPPAGTPLLRLGETCREAASRADLDAAALALSGGQTPNDPSVAGRCQGFAVAHGSGRLAVLGEAGMFSAQRVTLPNASGAMREFSAGMNVSGFDNQQLALNLTRWLERAG